MTTLTPPSTRTDAAVLAGLEFQPPCQHSDHRQSHVVDQPASWVVKTAKCPACGNRPDTFFLCDSGLEQLRESRGLCCIVCPHEFTFAEAYTAILSIRGGARS
jgi:hypothetical protein